MSVLESSDLVFLLPPYHRNFGKRLVKTPKLYFLDTGLACWLLGIRSPEVLSLHPSRGALFETWVVAEFVKGRFNLGLPTDLYFWRDNNGLEADLIFEIGARLQPVEIKSGQTVTRDYVRAGQASGRFAGDEALPPWLIYGVKRILRAKRDTGNRLAGYRARRRPATADFHAVTAPSAALHPISDGSHSEPQITVPATVGQLATHIGQHNGSDRAQHRQFARDMSSGHFAIRSLGNPIVKT